MIVAGAVVQGSGHLAAGRGCQDAFKAADLGGAVVLAVADGAGSRERSALGAHLAVDAACRVLAEGVPATGDAPEAWTGWAAAGGARLVAEYLGAAQAVLGATTGEAADVGALAATVAAAVVRPPWVAFVSVGDCFGTVLTREARAAERCHLVLPPPAPGGPGPVFLSSPGAALRVRTFVVWEPELSGVVLATDGCAALSLDHPEVHGLPPEAGPVPATRFFCGLAATLRANGGDAEPLRALLSGPAAARTGDDLTVLCAVLDGR
ncbi:protein phosphatase 2C domain-containing protein [Kitasatospora sp. NPDC001159]